jgi:hypothetical protein
MPHHILFFNYFAGIFEWDKLREEQKVDGWKCWKLAKMGMN